MIELIEGDSFELIKRVPDQSVSLVMTDVPYPDMKIHDGTKVIIRSDQWIEWFEPLAREIHRVLTPKGSFVTTINSKLDRAIYFEWVVWMRKVLKMHYPLTHYWVKENIIPGSVKSMRFPRDGVDFIAWFTKSEDYFSDLTAIEDWSVYNPHIGKIPTNMIYASVRDDYCYWEAKKATGIDHTGKYPELVPDFFLRILTVVGDQVLEPFNGTGTTSLVAARLGRSCIGFEKNTNNITLAKKIYEIAQVEYRHTVGWSS